MGRIIQQLKTVSKTVSGVDETVRKIELEGASAAADAKHLRGEVDGISKKVEGLSDRLEKVTREQELLKLKVAAISAMVGLGGGVAVEALKGVFG